MLTLSQRRRYRALHSRFSYEVAQEKVQLSENEEGLRVLGLMALTHDLCELLEDYIVGTGESPRCIAEAAVSSTEMVMQLITQLKKADPEMAYMTAITIKNQLDNALEENDDG